MCEAADIHAHTHARTHARTHTRDNYSNPRYAHARRGLIIMGVVIFIGVAMQPEAIVAATVAVSQERKSFTTNHTSILKIVRFNAQNMAQFDA